MLLLVFCIVKHMLNCFPGKVMLPRHGFCTQLVALLIKNCRYNVTAVHDENAVYKKNKFVLKVVIRFAYCSSSFIIIRTARI